jgi:hypothetical protein
MLRGKLERSLKRRSRVGRFARASQQPMTGFIVEKNRDDKTPLKLFVAGASGWGADLRRHVGISKYQ